jgi:hypothetical protein
VSGCVDVISVISYLGEKRRKAIERQLRTEKKDSRERGRRGRVDK